MGIEENLRIDRINPANEPAPADPKVTEPGAFQRVLEELEKLAAANRRRIDEHLQKGKNQDGETSDLERLNQDVQKADDEFKSAMDLRRMLEDAYRKAQE